MKGIPKAMDWVFYTLQRKVLTGASLITFGLASAAIGIVVLSLPTNDEVPLYGHYILSPDGGYVYEKFEKENNHDQERTC